MLKNASVLMFISLRRTSDMLAAMEARCYDGEIRFMEKSRKVNGQQVFVSAALLISVFIIGVWGLGV